MKYVLRVVDGNGIKGKRQDKGMDANLFIALFVMGVLMVVVDRWYQNRK